MAKNDSKQQEIQKQSNKKNQRGQGQIVDKKLDGDNFPAT
ncbi:hypothetical protein TCA2_2952 [Paenibacillus sp. TCA20]|nr:hypothetical protein TCA2_2952 [Paenibacillus sp. TCA20]